MWLLNANVQLFVTGMVVNIIVSSCITVECTSYIIQRYNIARFNSSCYTHSVTTYSEHVYCLVKSVYNILDCICIPTSCRSVVAFSS